MASDQTEKPTPKKLRDARKTIQAALTKAQDDLKSVTTVRQEAVLVTMNILE